MISCGGKLLEYQNGHCIRVIEHEASSLVTSQDSSQLITLRRIDSSSRYLLHRLDLESGRSTPWGELELAIWSKTCRGGRWYVVCAVKEPWAESPLYALDTNEASPRFVAQSEPNVYEPCELRLMEQTLWIEMSSFGSTEYASYELPSLRRLSYQGRLQLTSEREALSAHARYLSPFPPTEHPTFVLVETERVSLCGPEQEWSFALTPTPGLSLPVDLPSEQAHLRALVRQSSVSFQTFGCWAAVLFRHANGSEVLLFDVKARRALLQQSLREAASASLIPPKLSTEGTRLAAWTEAGEVFVVDATRPEESWLFQV